MNHLTNGYTYSQHLETAEIIWDKEFICEVCGTPDPDSIEFKGQIFCIECYQIAKNQ